MESGELLEIILKILSWVVPAAVSFGFGLLTSKFKKEQAKNEKLEEERKAAEKTKSDELAAIKSACMWTLRKALKEDWEFYTNQGWCSVEEKAEVDALYTLYHTSFNGNGVGSRYYNEIIGLPNHPDDKE